MGTETQTSTMTTCQDYSGGKMLRQEYPKINLTNVTTFKQLLSLDCEEVTGQIIHVSTCQYASHILSNAQLKFQARVPQNLYTPSFKLSTITSHCDDKEPGTLVNMH